ncbi:MAG TPA: hypothetical protein VL728_15765 [Cyclobacteriaceae bacterium]|nr:hypothetical protein [Cyclobacteriaceae bacterium]
MDQLNQWSDQCQKPRKNAEKWGFDASKRIVAKVDKWAAGEAPPGYPLQVRPHTVPSRFGLSATIPAAGVAYCLVLKLVHVNLKQGKWNTNDGELSLPAY